LVPAVALCDCVLFAAIVFAAAAVPVALKVTGLPFGTVAVACTVLVPAVVPRVQLVSVATPFPSVLMALVGATVPPPDAAVTVNVTATPLTPLPLVSVTLTEGGAPTLDATVAD
jgi:hypothetical protein